MGAACSNSKSAQVADSVKIKDKDQLARDAQTHLKMLQAGSEVTIGM